MTIAPCFAGVNAAQEPRPANGLSGIPSTITGTSVRAQARRTTPSGVVVAWAPAARPIRSASSLASAAARDVRPPLVPIRTATNPPASSSFRMMHSPLLLPVGLSLPDVGHLEVVEIRLGVGLGPQADLAG